MILVLDPRETLMTSHKSATGDVRALLRLEGLALCTAALALYAHSGKSWRWCAALFLVPDLSFAFYLFGPRAGAAAYNSMHSTLGAFVLAAAGWFARDANPLLLPIAFIWFAHIGFDRALGYGLKYASGFSDTHLGTIGRKARQAA